MKSSVAVRDRILDTASELFYRQGYNSTGINQIIDEAEIARASLYHHFKSKNDLLYAYLEKTNDAWFAQLHQFIKKQKTPEDKILAMFDFRIKRQTANKFGGCPFLKASSEIPFDDAKAFEIINTHKMKFKALLLEILNEKASEDHSFSKTELTETLFLLIEGATMTANYQKNKSALESAKAMAAKLLS
ncbi:MAG TPA: TetR/AcrR family transcriptional regulator [Flavobacteriaceae bacterium]|nr:TetR/AcrR family transcriptional regulator [Flavobacteriaceae bacterium]